MFDREIVKKISLLKKIWTWKIFGPTESKTKLDLENFHQSFSCKNP